MCDTTRQTYCFFVKSCYNEWYILCVKLTRKQRGEEYLKKKLLSLLLALVMTATLLPVQAMAAEVGSTGKGGLKTVYTMEYVNPLYADALGAETSGWSQPKASMQWAADVQTAADEPYLTEAEAVKVLRSQMIARSNDIHIKLRTAPTNDHGAVVKNLWHKAQEHIKGSGTTGDYLLWQYGGIGGSFSYRQLGRENEYDITYGPNRNYSSTIWYTTAAQEQWLNNYISGTMRPQLALDTKTTYQKVEAIYNWITEKVRYDYAHLEDPGYQLQFTAYAAVRNRTAVCQGYANLLYRLANDAGIDCRIITGGNHAWNILQMNDGKYYCMDATWDEGQSSYSYFLKGLPEFGKTHSPQTDPNNTPYWTSYVSRMSDTDYNSAFAEAPANVTMRTAAVSGKNIVVTWQQAAGAAKYKVFRKDPVNTGWKIVATVTGLSYTDKNVTPGVKYSYTVRGINTEGALSPDYNRNGVSATVPKSTTPANVKLVGAKAVTSGIQVTWQAADGAAQYRVYRKDAANPKWTVLTSSATGTSYTDKTAKAGVKYTYTVRGIAKDGKTLSPDYNRTGVSATMPKTSTAPATVKLVGAKAVSGGIQVTWQKAAGAAQYRVYRKDATNTKWTALTSSATGTSYTDKTAKAGVKYTYTVRGIAKDGKTLSPDYNRTGVSATMPKTSTAPATVKLVGAKAVSGGIQVTWQKAAGAAQYRVYRKDATNTKWTALTSSATGTSYTDKTAKAGVKYTYTVRGIAKDGKTLSPDYNKTGVSATIPKTTVSSVPAEVKMKDVTASGSYIKVNWERAANASAYRVYRRINNNTDWHVVASSVNGTSYTDRNVEPGVRYSYTVRGIASDGKTLSKTYDRVGDFAFARISADTLANDSVLKIFPIADVPYNLTRINWDYLQYYYKGNSIEQLPSEFGGKLRLLFNNDGTVYLVTGNGVGRGVYSADELVISIVFPGSDIPQVYVATFTRLDKYTYLHLMPDISGREALVFGAMSQR